MRFVFHSEDSLPKLAWCAEMSRKDEQIHVYHGRNVETTDTFFVEGAWNGSFADGDFASSSLLMGSGGRTTGSKAVFSTPSHALEWLNMARVGERLCISNSLVFLLQRCDLDLDPKCVYYILDLRSIRSGLNRCIESLPTTSPTRIELLRFCNLEVDADLRTDRREKVDIPRESFADFSAYRRFLVTELAEIHDNANAAERTAKYKLLSTISSGYDSAACSVIARDLGNETALTFRNGKSPSGISSASDSGVSIAEKLGLRIAEFDLDAYRRIPGMPEAEFAAAGETMDIQMASFEDHLGDRILVTGFRGGRVWDRLCRKPTRDHAAGDATGCSLAEFRLRVGFIHIPLPTFGFSNHPEIHQITQSHEMHPWTLFNSYDRPIPRRIVEEAGIDREAFGQRKEAAALAFNHLPPAPESARSFEAFWQRHKHGLDNRKRILHNITHSIFKPIRRFDEMAKRRGLPTIPCPIPVNATPRASPLPSKALSEVATRRIEWQFPAPCRR
jgi:hypothetical protein